MTNVVRASAAEQMMATLPEEWRNKGGRARKKTGTFQGGKKRPGGPVQSPPPKKKQQVGVLPTVLIFLGGF